MARAVTTLLLLSCVLSLSAQTIEKGKIVEGMTCASDPTQSYSIYIPSTLTTDRRWPLLYLFDPRGRATKAAELFRPAAETYGWIIISSNDTRSDGPAEPNMKALKALIPEAGRYPVDGKRVYMAGFSGGAMLAFLVGAESKGGIAGVIGSGGRFPEGWKKAPVRFSHWGSAGITDFNHAEMRDIDAFLEKTGATHRFEPFDGAHEWMPPSEAGKAVAWMELDAMRRGSRERDALIIERLYEADVSEARELESRNDPALLLRRWKNIESTFRGLRDTAQASAKVKELQGTDAVREALRDEKRWDAYEKQMLRQLGVAVATLRHEEAPIAMGRLTAELRIDDVRKRAASTGYEALAAQRVLSSMYSQMSFYLYREFAAAGRYDRVAQVLEIAEMLRPGSAFVRFNLGCALARVGERRRALDALESAVEAGFTDAKLMREDEDLASLRDDPRFRALLEKLQTATPGVTSTKEKTHAEE